MFCFVTSTACEIRWIFHCVLEEISLNFIQKDFFKNLCYVCLHLPAYFLLCLQRNKRASRMSFINLFCVLFVVCFCFVFLSGTSSDWSCSFDGTPVNDIYAAWSKANKPFCTCVWNSGELFFLMKDHTETLILAKATKYLMKGY